MPITPEQAAQMGFKPINQSSQISGGGITPEQATQMGFKPITQQPQSATPQTKRERREAAGKPVGINRVAGNFGKFFSGEKIGQAIGAGVVRGQTRRGKFDSFDYSTLTPEAKARLEAKGVPTTQEAARQELAGQVKGPGARAVVGDILGAGVDIATAAIPASKGVKAAQVTAKTGALGKVLRPALGAAIEGGVAGAGFGAARAVGEADSFKQGLGMVGTGAVTGTVTGGVASTVLPLVAKGGNAVVKKLSKQFTTETPEQVTKRISDEVAARSSKIATPTTKGRADMSGILRSKKDLDRAYKVIARDSDNIFSQGKSFTDIDGNTIENLTGVRSIVEMPQVLDEAKRVVWSRIDDALTQATGSGVKVDTKSIQRELADAAARPGTFESERLYTEQLIKSLQELDGQSPLVIQDYLAKMNKRISSVFNNASETVNKSIDAKVVQGLNDVVDATLDATDNPAIRQAKLDYSALKTLEKDLIPAIRKEFKKGATSALQNQFDGQDIGVIAYGAFTQNPGLLAASGLSQISKAIRKLSMDPNRNMRKLFEVLLAAKETYPQIFENLGSEAVSQIVEQADARIPGATPKAVKALEQRLTKGAANAATQR